MGLEDKYFVNTSTIKSNHEIRKYTTLVNRIRNAKIAVPLEEVLLSMSYHLPLKGKNYEKKEKIVLELNACKDFISFNAAQEFEATFIAYDSNKDDIIKHIGYADKNQLNNITYTSDKNYFSKETFDLVVDNSNYNTEGKKVFSRGYDLLKDNGKLIIFDDKKQENDIFKVINDSSEHFETIELNNLFNRFFLWVGQKK